VVLRDGRRRSGEINYIGERGSKDCLLLSYDNIALGEISFVKFSDRSFYSLRHALRAPRRATHLTLRQTSREARLLSARLGHLTNLKTLNISCWDDVRVNLPAGIGHLVKLERLIINSGNGCFLAVTLPTSIGKLKNLKALVMNGALSGDLPKTLASLPNLEELEMSREGLESVPSLIASLRNLRKLTLDDNDIAETPAFITNLKNLKELSFIGNGGIKLRDSLANMKGLKVHLGNNSLKLADQELLRRRFPDLVLDFENVMLDGTVNEEPPPKK
jgi:Leucine-rich repeat (LRR) protein